MDLVRSAPAVAGGVVYVGSRDRKVYAVDADTGSPVWTVTVGGIVDAAPVVAGGVVYVGAGNGRLYGPGCGHRGRPLEHQPRRAGRRHPRRGRRPRLPQPGRPQPPGCRPGHWRHHLVGRRQLSPVASTPPTVANGVLYHGTSSGTLVARDPATGTVLWSDATAVRSTSGVTAGVVADGAVYGSRSSGVTAHHR